MMSSPGAVHGKEGNGEGKAPAVGTTGAASKAEAARMKAMTYLGRRLASLATWEQAVEGGQKERDSAEENEVTGTTTSKEQEGRGTTGQGDGKAQHNLQAETASSSSTPPPMAVAVTTTATAAASKVTPVDPPGRRFPKYERMPQIPGTATTSSSWRRKDGDRPRGLETGAGADCWDKMKVGSLGEGRKRIDSLGAGKAPRDWLWEYLKEPRGEKMEKMIYYEDELCVVIYDRFPKARFHLLLIAKDLPVKKPSDLKMEHLPAQRRLHDVGRAIAMELSRQGAGESRLGYHVHSSVEPLHMHIISQDFDSKHLFKTAHWNSFTTDLFMDCSLVEARLEELGSLDIDKDKYKTLEHQPAKCFRCGLTASVNSLKKHNLECDAPLPAGGGATSIRGKSAQQELGK